MVEDGSRSTKECSRSFKNNEWNISMWSREPMCPPGYHYTGCVATRKLGHTMYGYTLMVFKIQRWLKLMQEKWVKKIGRRLTKTVQEAKRNNEWNVSMWPKHQTMCLPGYYDISYAAILKLGNFIYNLSLLMFDNHSVLLMIR